MPRQFILIITFLFCSIWAGAQSYSYIYIQGDKQTPFYTKLEGEMQPRYGKNYCIISKLEAGAVNIDILFQQNAFPAQHFIILVPENGSRSFMITHKGEEFSLYDLQQQFYLPAGNKAEDDRLPAPGAKPAPVAVAAVAEQTRTTTDDTPAPEKIKEPKPAAQPQKQDSDGPKFIDHIELNNNHQSQEPRTADAPKPVPADNTAAVPTTTTVNTPPAQPATGAIINSDCPQAIDDDRFQEVYKKTAEQASEESKLGYLNQQAGNCISVAQATLLVKTLESDPAKYTYLKKIYPHITDQASFSALESVFTDEGWKQYFRQLVHH